MPYSITEECDGCGACVRVCPADAITGEKKKLYKIDGELCIECGACGRVCPRAAVLDAAGVPCVIVRRSEWPKPELIVENCTACGLCVDACPVGCFEMSELPRSGGFDAYPWLREPKACIGCGFCSLECPSDALVMKKPEKTIKKETAAVRVASEAARS
jgi:ferredoxin